MDAPLKLRLSQPTEPCDLVADLLLGLIYSPTLRNLTITILFRIEYCEHSTLKTLAPHWNFARV